MALAGMRGREGVEGLGLRVEPRGEGEWREV